MATEIKENVVKNEENAAAAAEAADVSEATGAPTKRKRGRKPKADSAQTHEAVSAKPAETAIHSATKSVFEGLLARNAVPGFDPYDGVVGYRQEDGNVKLQMPAAIAMQWFLAKYPGGTADVTIVEKFSTDTYAVFNCQLKDGNGNAIGFPGIGSCQYNEADEVHRNFVQSAQTKAIACALRNNGFCTPYDSRKTERTIIIGESGSIVDDEPTDNEMNQNPQNTPAAPAPAKEAEKTPPTMDELKKQGLLFSASKLQDKGSKGETTPTEPPIMVEDEGPAPSNAPKPSANPPESEKGEDADISPMPLEEALNFPIPTGPHKGDTMKETVEKCGCGAVRFYTGSRYIGTAVYRAAKAVCAFYNG